MNSSSPNDTTSNATSENHAEALKFPRIATCRMTALASDMRLSSKAASALSLLHLIVLACGAEDTCCLLLPDLVRDFGVPHPTLKSWLKKLAEAGFITKEPAGRDGVRITLTETFLKTIDVNASANPIANLIQQVSAVKSVIGTAMDQLIVGLKTEEAA